MTQRLAMLWASAGAWGLLFGLPGITTRLLTPPVPRLAMVSVGALLVSLAVVASVARCISASPFTYRALAGVVASLACYSALVAATLRSEMMWVDGLELSSNCSAFPPGSLDRVYDLSKPTTARMAAGVVYNEFGVRAAYRGDTGVATIFEPSPAELEKRHAQLDRQRTSAEWRNDLSRASVLLRETIFLYLASLPVVASAYLLWLKAKGRAP